MKPPAPPQENRAMKPFGDALTNNLRPLFPYWDESVENRSVRNRLDSVWRRVVLREVWTPLVGFDRLYWIAFDHIAEDPK